MRSGLKTKIGIVLILTLVIGSVAACSGQTKESLQTVDKPEIEGAVPGHQGGGMMPGVLAYDIVELIGSEPFQADQILPLMPVYRNEYETDGAGVPFKPATREMMREIGSGIADVLELTIDKEEDYGNMENRLVLISSDVKIQVEGNKTVYIDFGEKYPLPKKMKGRSKDYMNAMDYAINELGPLLKYWGLNHPVKEITYDYTFDGEKNFHCSLADEKSNRGSLKIDFLNSNISSIRWSPNQMTEDTIKGEYPTITYEEAKSLLLEGQYYSVIPLKDPIKEEDIKGTSIGYLTQCYDKVFLPFYYFYVDTTNREEVAMPEETARLGLRSYTSYLVPAIQDQYLDQFPEISIKFN